MKLIVFPKEKVKLNKTEGIEFKKWVSLFIQKYFR